MAWLVCGYERQLQRLVVFWNAVAVISLALGCSNAVVAQSNSDQVHIVPLAPLKARSERPIIKASVDLALVNVTVPVNES